MLGVAHYATLISKPLLDTGLHLGIMPMLPRGYENMITTLEETWHVGEGGEPLPWIPAPEMPDDEKGV